MKKVLITGITGFVGSHLAHYLLAKEGYAVSGIHASDRHLDNIAPIKDKIELFKADLTDSEKTAEIVAKVKPDLLFHLAASASVGNSFEKPLDVLINNAGCEVNILEGVKKAELSTKIIVISSAQVYGYVSEKDLPLDENTQFKPDSPYAVSKITQEYLALQYFFAYKQQVIILRPFNHIGPRLAPIFSISRFAKAIAEIEKGKHEPVLTVGNLSAKRDFGDVRDVVRAYVLATEKCTPGEIYNIGTGVSYTIKETLDKLLALSKVKITVKTDESLLRPSDNPELRADSSKFMQATGWRAEIPFEKTLEDLLAYWRGIV